MRLVTTKVVRQTEPNALFALRFLCQMSENKRRPETTLAFIVGLQTNLLLKNRETGFGAFGAQ